ncbi:MAG TPA: CHAT domain-containing protein [Anaerolineales bacterium]|nr:CHAT domain-containing protein [Anaerolineales bacterium]
MTAETEFHRAAREWLAVERHRPGPDPLAFTATNLPDPDKRLLARLGDIVERASLSEPIFGWAFAAAVDSAAVRSGRPDLQAPAAFHLAQSANHLTRPAQVVEAAERAQRLYTGLGSPGWSAAAVWQRYEQPWTHPDFLAAARELEAAVDVMRTTGPEFYIPHALRSLAFARILRWDFEGAERALVEAEDVFRVRGDELNLARCWLYRAGLLRRQGAFEAAAPWLERGREVFEGLGAVIELGRVDYHNAGLHLFWKTDLPTAQALFEKAGATFEQAGIPLWTALCDNGLAQVHIKTGDLRPALGRLEKARKTYAHHGVLGSLADNLVDAAQLESAAGRYRDAVDKNREAEALYAQIGVERMEQVARMYQGEAWAQIGRYQTALSHLEHAYEGLSNGDRLDRTAECEVILAQVWLALNRPDRAAPLLEKALDWYRKSENGSYLALAHFSLARAAGQQGDAARRLQHLRSGLEVAGRAGLAPLVAFSHRLLGGAYSATGETARAEGHFRTAAERFEELGMPAEEAICMVLLGRCRLDLSTAEQSRSELEIALALSRNSLPEVDWQAHAGLAELAAHEYRRDEALKNWDRMARTLSLLRLGFTQPALYQPYQADHQGSLDRAVSFAAGAGRSSSCLGFIEETKALLLSRSIAGGAQPDLRRSPELEGLREEITWRKTRLDGQRAGGTIFRTAGERQRLAGLIRQYEELFARLERESRDPGGLQAAGPFSLERFRETAGRAFRGEWLALDFYSIGREIVCVLLDPDRVYLVTLIPSDRFSLALDRCRKAHLPGFELSSRELEDLGSVLIPPAAAARLTPDKTLLISPHRELHAVPWPALRLRDGEEGAQYLVERCRPLLVPSLNAFTILAQRRSRAEPPPRRGLLVAAGSFQDRHPALPQIEAEIRTLSALLGEGIELLSGEAATWDNLLAARGDDGLKGYAFLHLATHAFHDSLTARLSGFALYDRDAWLEDLWDLAPLPPLVTVSACSGTRSLLHAGDEPSGLAATCLAAGAGTVIGSLWPVLDRVSAERTADLYAALKGGDQPAGALAAAQRAAVGRGEAPDGWGGYMCLGCGVG